MTKLNKISELNKKLKVAEEENAKLKREDAFRHANCIVAQRLDGDLPCAALRAAREEIAKLKGHAEAVGIEAAISWHEEQKAYYVKKLKNCPELEAEDYLRRADSHESHACGLRVKFRSVLTAYRRDYPEGT